MPLLQDSDLVRIELPEPSEWVDVKRRPSRGDQVKVQRAIVAGARLHSGDTYDIDAGTALEAAEFAALDLAIKRWSFSEPVTPENIRKLDPESVDAIKESLNELWKPREDDEVKNSSENGAPTRREKEAAPAI